VTPIFLFDVSAYLHRAMYVCYGDKAAEIVPTDTTFLRHACGMLANTMEKLDVQRMVVVCDSTEPSFRCDEFPAYKAERKAHYPVFATGMPLFFGALADISVSVVAAPRYEADDLIATMVADRNERFVVVTSDKDLLALLTNDHHVRAYDPMKDLWLGTADVREKFGVDPSQLYDYVGLVGDTSDGIPGVKSIGPKTAAKLLREFDSLDEIYSEDRREALAEYASKSQFTTLMANKDLAFMSRKLASPRICSTLNIAGDTFQAPDPRTIRRACS